MIILIDIGNSRVKWAALESGGLGGARGMSHRDVLLDELWDTLFQGQSVPARVVVANVGGDAIEQSLATWVRRVWGVEVEASVAAASCCGVHNGYFEYGRLGVDRWLAMIGAYTAQAGPLCVVDCGTAMTVDVVNGAGRHLGGWIMPGLGAMQAVLRQRTQGVRLDFLPEAGAGVFGRDTAEAVREGTCRAAVGLVVQALALLGTMATEAPRCVVTGGDAITLLPLLPPGCQHVPDLVLRGLAAVVRVHDAEMGG